MIQSCIHHDGGSSSERDTPDVPNSFELGTRIILGQGALAATRRTRSLFTRWIQAKHAVTTMAPLVDVSGTVTRAPGK